MAITLVEAAKLERDPLKRAVINELAAGQILAAIPFENELGTGIHYNKVDSLPGVQFRGLGEGYSATAGVINPQSEAFSFYGTDVDVDQAIVALKGSAVRSQHEQLAVEALRAGWEYQFIKGSKAATQHKGFDGLQVRVTGSQLVSNAAAGGALSMAKLDEAISRTKSPTALIMNWQMRDRLSAASRNNSLGFTMTPIEKFGHSLLQYRGVPILCDDPSNEILGFTETSPDGSSSTACSSIYAISFGSMAITGIQGRNGSGSFGVDVRDLGEVPDKPVLRTRIEWYSSFAIYNGFSVSRLYGITNAAVTA